MTSSIRAAVNVPLSASSRVAQTFYIPVDENCGHVQTNTYFIMIENIPESKAVHMVHDKRLSRVSTTILSDPKIP